MKGALRLKNMLPIRTPEGVTFSLVLATPLTRGLAMAIDTVVVVVSCSLISVMISVLALLSADGATALATVLYFVITMGYGIYFEWTWRGQTLGKWFLGLRVLDENGLRLTFAQIVVRNLVRVVDLLPGFYLVGGVACWMSRKTQRLGDLAACTVVVRETASAPPDWDRVLGERMNSMRGYPHLCARLRQKTRPVEAELALQALLRRDEFEDEARIEIFRELAAHFGRRCAFPASVTEDLPDEQFVRNVVDILYRPRATADGGEGTRSGAGVRAGGGAAREGPV